MKRVVVDGSDGTFGCAAGLGALGLCAVSLGMAGVALGQATMAPTGPGTPAPRAAPVAQEIATSADDSRHNDLEHLFAKDRHQEGMAIADRRLGEDPKDPELYVHAFRFRFALLEQVGRRDQGIDKEARYEEMLSLVERGLELAPAHPRLLWGRGIARARLGTTRGVLASLFLAKHIEADWSAVVDSDYTYQAYGGLEVLPCDAMVGLGIFYRLVPDLWIVDLVAGTRGDLDKSVALLERADRCRTNGIGTKKELGASLLCKGHRDDDDKAYLRGLKVLKDAVALTPTSVIQRLDQRHAQTILADPQKACGYSRDGQQEVDEDALERAELEAAPRMEGSKPNAGGPAK